jgi:hypothetical protein
MNATNALTPAEILSLSDDDPRWDALVEDSILSGLLSRPDIIRQIQASARDERTEYHVEVEADGITYGAFIEVGAVTGPRAVQISQDGAWVGEASWVDGRLENCSAPLGEGACRALETALAAATHA